MKYILALVLIFNLSAMDTNTQPGEAFLRILQTECNDTKADLEEVNREDAEWKSKQHLTKENLFEVADYYSFLMCRQWRMQKRIHELTQKIKKAEGQ